MKFFICFCLVVLVAHHAIAYDPNQKPVLRQIHNKIGAENLYLRDNSWLTGKRSRTRWGDSYTWYDWVKFLKDIPENGTLLYYKVQWLNRGVIWDSWDDLFRDTADVCILEEDTQDGSIVAIIRELVGIPEGCPIAKGTTKDTSDIHFPLQDEELIWNVDVRGKQIRILADWWSSGRDDSEMMLTGIFYVDGDSYLPFEADDSDDDE